MMKELFHKRISALYKSWNFHKQELWGNSDIVVIHTQTEKNSNLLSTQFYLWLFGEELNDTTAIFGPFGIYFFSTQKHFAKIRSLCAFATMVQQIPVSVQLKSKNDDGFLLIDSTIRNSRVIRNKNEKNEIFGDENDSPFVVGYVEGEYPKTKFFWSCINDLEPKKYKAVSVNSGLNKLFNTAAEKGVSEKSASSKLDQGKSSKSLSGVNESASGTDEEISMLTSKSMSGVNESALGTDEYISMLTEKLELSSSSYFGRHEKCRVPKGVSKKSTSSKLDQGESSKSMSGVKESALGTDEEMSVLMEDLELSASSSFRNWFNKEEISKKRNKDGDQLFKFGASRLDGKEDKSNEGGKKDDQLFKFGGNRFSEEDIGKEKNKNGDQLFKFGASRLEGKHEKSRKGNKSGDPLFRYGGNWYSKEDISKENNKNGDQLFKFGATRVDGKEDKARERNNNGDQLFKFGGNLLDAKEDKSNEGSKDGDQLLKLGEGKTDGDVLGGNRFLRKGKKELKHVKLLRERLTAFYSSWRNYKEEQWGKADTIVITTESVVPLDALPCSMSLNFLVWLLDQVFPNTTAVFTHAGIEFLCTKESLSRLRSVGLCITMAAKVPVSVQLKKEGELCLDWLKKTLCQVNTPEKSGPNSCPLVVGCIRGASVTEALSHSSMFELAYVDNGLRNLLGLGNLLAEEQNRLYNTEKNNFLQLKECGEQSSPMVEDRIDDSVQKVELAIGATDDTNSLPHDLNGSRLREDAVVDEHDEWTLIEREFEEQEPKVAEKVTWKRWFMDKTTNSFSLKDKLFDDASLKEE